MNHLPEPGSNKEKYSIDLPFNHFSSQFIPTLQENTNYSALLPNDALGRGGIRNSEERLAELRRENFRVRLNCFNYGHLYKNSNNPQDFESSRLFEAEAENLSLKESIAEKHVLLTAASKMIDALKEENDAFEQQLRDMKTKLEVNEEEWRHKYDALYQELENSKALVRSYELRLLTLENDRMRQDNDAQSRIAELEVHLQSTRAELERKQRELDSFQQEADRLRLSLEQFEREQPGAVGPKTTATQSSDCVSPSCQHRLDELIEVVHRLHRQLNDAGLTPEAVLPVDFIAKPRDPLGPITMNKQAADSGSASAASNVNQIAGGDGGDGTGSGGHADDDPQMRIAYLSQRLDSARHLLLEIGNEKLRQDKLIDRLQATITREQQSWEKQNQSLNKQLEDQKQLHCVELTRRDEEMQRLHQRVAQLTSELNNLMTERGSLMSEVDKAQERNKRLQWEHTEACEKMTKELREKQRLIKHLQIALSTLETRDVTQYSLPDEARLAEPSGTPGHEHHPHEQGQQLEDHDDEEAVLRQQLLSISHQGQELALAVESPVEDKVEPTVQQVPASTEVNMGKLSKRAHRRHRTETYSLDVKKTAENDGSSRATKNDSNSLEDTNTVSLGSDNITSFDVTKDMAQMSYSSTGNSIVNSPTVSTPPLVPDSPDYSNAMRTDQVPVSRYSSITEDSASHSSSDQRNKLSTNLNWSKQSTKNVQLSTSGIIHSLSVGPLTPPSPLCEKDQGEGSDAGTSDHPSPADPLPNQPQPACAIRELYNLIHNLKLQLDTVKFTEHSFVEMVNRSLSTAGINASFQFSPKNTHASLLLKPTPSILNESIAESSLPQPTRPSDLSKADATYGGTNTLFDNLSTSLQQNLLPEHSILSASGLNATMAELRLCPASPNLDALSPQKPTSWSNTASPRRGPTHLRPSRLPRAVGKSSNLIGSMSVCEDTDKQPSARPHPLSVSFTAGESKPDWPPSVHAPQHSAIGDLTMVEWQNRDLFERLSQATARLRDALEECADVSSELWYGDVSQRLLTMLSTHQLDTTQSSEQKQAEQDRCVDDKTPEPTATRPDLDSSVGYLTQNRSVRFDGADPLPPHYELITPEESLTQLYGSAWRSGSKLAMSDEPGRSAHGQPGQMPSVATSPTEIPHHPNSSNAKSTATGDKPREETANAVRPDQNEMSCTPVKQVATPTALRQQQPYGELHESAAKHLEELSRLAEQLSRAQDRITCLERERQELLALLPDSVGTTVTELASVWNRLCEERDELKLKLTRTVFPSIEDHRQLSELVERLRADLSSRDKTVDQQQAQFTQFMDRFRATRVACDSDNYLDCMNALFTELSSTQTALKTLREEHDALCKTTVRRTAFDELQHQLHSLQSEYETIAAQLASADDRMEQMEQLLLTEFPEQSEQPIMRLTELLISELHELRDAVDQFTHEQQVTYTLLRDICPVPDSSTLTGFAEVVKQTWHSTEAELAREKAERDRALDLLRGMNLPTVHDPDTLCGYLQACVTCLTEKQDEINRLGLLCERNEESMRQMVPVDEFEQVKSQLDQVSEQLDEAQNELHAVEAQLEDVVRSSVPFETFERKNERVAFLEKQLEEVEALRDHDRDQIVSLITEKTSHTVTADNWVEVIGHICDEFAAITASMNRLHNEYEIVLSECQELREQVAKMVAEVDENSSQVQREHEAALAALRESLNSNFTQKLQTLTEEQNKSTKQLIEELDSARCLREELTDKLKRRDSELNEIGDKLHEAEREIGHLRDSIALHVESAKAANETAKAHERRADELASHLECLREEHRKCPAQLELVDAQTSPATEGPVGNELDVAPTSRPPSTEISQARLRKYGELKAVAFEIKEKLIRRTDKLEVALTEVARLRSVIQQDKEHASRILEEVEDLRKQAIRKNKRIHELEGEVARLKSNQAGSHPVASAPRSSTRTISEVEQPRGAQFRPQVPETRHINASSIMHGPTTASLLQCPDTPIIDPTEAAVSLSAHSDATSLLFESANPQHAHSVDDAGFAATMPNHCERCTKLQSLIFGMRRLTTELQHRLDVNLREEYSLLATLDSFDSQPGQMCSAMDKAERVASGAWRSLSTSNLAPNLSAADTFHVSINTSSLDDLRTMVKSLRHARSRLQHYASEMDRICGLIISQNNPVIGEANAHPGSTPGAAAPLDGELHVIIKRSSELLLRVYRRSKAFFKGLEVYNDVTPREVLADIRSVIKMLDSGSGASPLLSDSKSNDDKENQPVSAHYSQTDLHDKNTNRQLNSRATRYYRRYRDLAQGLDTMTKELSETNDLLTAARANLERTAGMSLLTNLTGQQLSKTQSPPTKPDSA